MAESLTDAAPPSRQPFNSLLAANAISFVGNQLTNIAIPWFVLTTTGSASKTGITAFFSILPVIIAGIFGGTIVDRLGFKRSSIIADLASGSTVALIAFLHLLGVLSFPLLLLLVFLGAFLDAPGTTARDSLIPDLAARANVTPENAAASLQAIDRGSRLIGAPIGGLLIAVFGAVGLLWLDAATFAVSATVVYLAVPKSLSSAKTESTLGYWSELREGFRFIRRDALVFAIVLTVMVTNFLDVAKGNVALPVMAKQVYNSSIALGLMYAASGGGAVIGAILYARFASRLSRRNVFIWSFILISMPMLALAFLPPLPFIIALQLVTGIAAGPLNPIIYAIKYERVPVSMRGRVFGAISSSANLAMPAGVLLGGYLIGWIGLGGTFGLLGAAYLLTTLSMLINPAIRQMDNRHAATSVAPAST
jgi:MFS family permease